MAAPERRVAGASTGLIAPRVCEAALRRIASDLAMVADRELVVGTLATAREITRPVGNGCIHISFKLGVQIGEHVLHGCLLVPLPDAVALAGHLMMLPEAAIKSNRAVTRIDGATKDALLEIGNFVGGATDAALREADLKECKVTSEGCQGVRAGVRPALDWVEGSPLIVTRARLKLGDWPECEYVLALPAGESA